MFLEMKFKSSELKKSVQVNAIIPEGRETYKTLWLLHGLTDDHTAWARYTSVERYARDRGIAVVMPNADRSWYTNTAYGANYFNFIADELPALCRRVFKGMSERREDNIVGGLSMGGYGALKLSLSRPEQYSGCICLSGAFDITRKGRFCPIDEWKSIFGFDLETPLSLERSEHDVFFLAENRKKAGGLFPKLYMWCGTDDSLLGVNRDLDRYLTELGVAHAFEESEGDHSWKWWDAHLQDGLKYILD